MRNLKCLAFAFALGCFPALSMTQALFDSDGKKIPDSEVNSDKVNWEIIKRNDSHPNGVGMVRTSRGRCTGSFIETHGKGTAPAYVLTNGHCIGRRLGPSDILAGQSPFGYMTFTPNFLAGEFDNDRSEIQVNQIAYASMKGTDLAVLQLGVSYQELKHRGFVPLVIDNVLPAVGERVQNIGIPMSGMDSWERIGLHRSTCVIGNYVDLLEDEYHFDGAQRNQCSIVGGSSGSPMISIKTGRIVAIMNTGVNDDSMGRPDCSMDRPCEVSSDGTKRSFPSLNYSQRVAAVASCFNEQGIFDLKLAACALESP